MPRRLLRVCLPLLGLCAVCLLLLNACETNSDTRGSDGDGGMPAFYISPAAATLNTDADDMIFAAVGGEAPFAWRVSDDTLGTVPADATDRSVVYSNTGAGDGLNVLTVEDNKGWTAQVTITHTAFVTTPLTITPNNVTLSAIPTNLLFTAGAGNAPYSWSVAGIAGAAAVTPVGSSDNSTALYFSGAVSGTAQVIVRDAANRTAVAIVNQ